MRARHPMAAGTAGALAALAVLGASGAALASAAPQLSLSVTPYKITASAHRFSVPVTLTNLSRSAVRVTTSVVTISGVSGHCGVSAPPRWARVSPAAFTMPAGGRERAVLTVAAPARASGSYDLAAVFTGHPDGAGTMHAAMHVDGAIGTRILLHYGGAQQAECTMPPTHRHRLAAAPGHGGISPLVVPYGSGAVALAAFGWLGWRFRPRSLRRARRRAAHTSGSHRAAW